MLAVPSFLKTPDERLDYTVDWTSWLEAGDTISAAPTWTVPAGLTLESTTYDTQKATAWLSGGALGKTYTVECRVTTQQGRVAERAIVVIIVNRR